jgi:nitroreductase
LDALEAIRTRRSVGKLLSDPVPRELIEQMLDAAVQAPNHHRTLPWRFWVLTGEARERLGEVMARAIREQLPELDGEAAQAALARERAKPLRAPALIVVAVDQDPADPVLSVEDLESGAAAVQNMLLAAHALGLGAMWRTGEAAYSPLVKAHFGLGPEDFILGFVYVGYAASQPAALTRSAEGRVEWWE